MYTPYTEAMFITVDVDDPRAIYQQVADGIKELIARGKLAEGAPLPPVRQLAADLGVNLNTIATAYRELRNDGLIVIRPGSGSVVASRTPTERSRDELVRPLRAALTELILAGVSTRKILDLVARELSMVGKGGV
jgi:GntR family transcriptional regulator